MKISPTYESKAVLPENAPAVWNVPYHNLVLGLESDLTPEQLLTRISLIEKFMGRPTKRAKWAPRIIDLDIIFAADLIVNEEELQIPHPQMHLRSFVLKPLADIYPDLVHPILKESVAELLSNIEKSYHKDIKKL